MQKKLQKRFVKQSYAAKVPTTKRAIMNSTPSIDTRNELSAFYRESGYKDIKFWVSPKSMVSKEECESQVLGAIKSFSQKKITAIPHADIFKKFRR